MKALLPLALLLGNLAAQPWLYNGPVETRSWPGATGTGKVTDSVAGRFTGAGYADVVALRDQAPVLFASPSALNCLTTTPILGAPSQCSAVAKLANGGSPLGHRREALLVAHANGLASWGLTGTTPIWKSFDGSAAWAYAEKLVVLDLNGDGNEDLVGISSGGASVRVRISGDNGLDATSVEYSQAFSTTVFDVAGVDWNGIGGKEIAVVTASGVELYSPELALLASLPGTTNAKALLATVRRPGGELLVAALAGTDAVWSLAILDPVNPGSVTLGAVGLVACAVGDADANGYDDIIFSQTYAHRALLMVQRPGYAFSYASGDCLEVPLLDDSSVPAPNNKAIPVLADLDGDSDADFVQGVESNQTMVVTRSVFGTGATMRLQDPGDNPNMEFGIWETRVTGGEYSALIANVAIEQLGTFPANATDIEVVMWQLQADATYESLWPTSLVSTQLIPATQSSLSLAFSGAEEIAMEDLGMLLLQLRPLRIVAGNIETVYAPSTFLVASDQYLPNLTAARGMSATGLEVTLLHRYWDWTPLFGDAGGGINVGGIVGVDPPPVLDPPPGGGSPPTGPG